MNSLINFIFFSTFLVTNVIQSYHPGISNIPKSIEHGDSGRDNIYGWDRLRRCDEEMNCKPCEGIGGIVWADKKDEITITECNVIADASQIDRSTLPKPIWGTFFQNSKYYEILIGEKAAFDPFCLQPIPGKNPNAKFCYRPEEGTIYYDFEDVKAIQIDLNFPILGVPKNISSTMIHQGKNFWIANKLWLNQDLCICVKFKNLYPLNPNWVSIGKFIARESIMVEYLWEEMVLDHYIAGPHHFWTDPKTGIVVRMWQPWNGLEVIDPRSREKLQKKIEYPPEMCKKGGATFRVNCDDAGFPIECNAYECEWDSEEYDNLSPTEYKRVISKIQKYAMEEIQNRI